MTEEKNAQRLTLSQRVDKAQQASEDQLAETRRCFDFVLSSPEGKKVFQFIYCLSASDTDSLCEDKQGRVDTEHTLAVIGAQAVYRSLLKYISSENKQLIETRPWEQKHKGEEDG